MPRISKVTRDGYVSELTDLAIKLKLTKNEFAFCEHYLGQLQNNPGRPNASEAARHAYPNQNARAALQTAYELLRRPRVVKFLEAFTVKSREMLSERVESLVMDEAEILERLTVHGRADVFDFMTLIPAQRNEKGEITKPGGWVVDVEKAHAARRGQAIKKLSYDERGAPKIELVDSQTALMHLARIFGLLKDDAPPPPQRIENKTLVIQLIESASPEARRAVARGLLGFPTEEKSA